MGNLAPMARRTGIFGRKSRRGGDSAGDLGSGEKHTTDPIAGETVRVQEFFDQESAELERALELADAPVDHEKVDYSITEDWEMPSAVRRPSEESDPSEDAGAGPDSGEWLAQPLRRRESSLLTPERPDSGRAPTGDTGEQITIAATGAAQRAEIRAMDEIVALERDLERAKSTAAAEVDELETSLREAEARATAAEETAAALTVERDEFEARAREAAKKWLRARIVELKAEAREKVRAEVKRVRAEAETRAAGGEVATTDNEGTVAAEADLRQAILSETEKLRRVHVLELAEADARVEAARREEQGRAADEVQRRVREAVEEAVVDPAQRQRELVTARAGAEAEAADRIARIEADADERLRSEVAIARRAAEERFAEKLEARERELEGERGQRIKLIEDSDRRLSRIEAQATEAVELVSAAEERLAAEAEQLRTEAGKHLAEEADRLRAGSLKERQEEVGNELRSIREELDRERATRASAVAEAEQRMQAAEEMARQAEMDSAKGAHEARLAASNWLRGETQALRRDGERAARERNGVDPDRDIEQAASTAAGGVSATAAAETRIAAERRSWDEERARLSAELAATRLEVVEMEARTADAAKRSPSESHEPVEESSSERRLGAAESKVEEAASKATAAGDRLRDGRSAIPSGPVAQTDVLTGAGEHDGPVSLAAADLAQLIGIGMSETQARRVIRYRDERGLSSVKALEDVPGFPRSFLDGLAQRLVD